MAGHLEASVHWSRWRALLILIIATVLMSACADLTTEHIQPILSHSPISQVDNAVNQLCRSILMYFCMYDLTLLFISVFHRCDSFGHGPWNPRNRQWSAVCSSEYNQFEVGLSVTLWASGHNNGQNFLSQFNHRFFVIFSQFRGWKLHCSAGVHDSDPHLGFIQHLLCEWFWICFFWCRHTTDIQWQLYQCVYLTIFLWQDVGFVLIFSDLHLWASIFSVIVVNYIFMDGKSDYFQGKSNYLNQGLVTLPKITSSSTDTSWQNAKLQTRAKKLQHYSNVWDQ